MWSTCEMPETLTVEEAFEAMREFVRQYNEREPVERRESIDQPLRWTERERDGLTSDPAQWSDWLHAVERARKV